MGPLHDDDPEGREDATPRRLPLSAAPPTGAASVSFEVRVSCDGLEWTLDQRTRSPSAEPHARKEPGR